MSITFTTTQLDRLLVDVVERLADEFPELPVAVVSRCVQAVRAMVQPCAPADVPALAGQVEKATRHDLQRIALALNAPVAAAEAL